MQVDMQEMIRYTQLFVLKRATDDCFFGFQLIAGPFSDNIKQ